MVTSFTTSLPIFQIIIFIHLSEEQGNFLNTLFMKDIQIFYFMNIYKCMFFFVFLFFFGMSYCFGSSLATSKRNIWRRQWHPTPVLLPGKSHGRRSLVGCSPWGCKESDTTERLPFHFSLSCVGEGNGNPLQCSCLKNPRDGGAS